MLAPRSRHRPPTARLRLPPPCHRVTILYVTSATCPFGTPWRQRWFPVDRASRLPGVERVVPLVGGEAHRARFPAVLTVKSVVCLLYDRTEGNTMIKVCRQVQENHMEDYYQRKDLYTTILMALVKPGGIVSALGHVEFQAAPLPRELPCARLLLHTLLVAEAENVHYYRSQVLKKLSGDGNGSVISIGNEFSPRSCPLLESVEKLGPMMCRGVMKRFRLANQPVPKILYIDRRCCKAQGLRAVETLFQPWVDDGMVVRLDIFHWHLPDEDVVRRYISQDQLKHHVHRVTLGAQETFRLVHLIIEELKGPTGLVESDVSLFKSPADIDEMWASQQ